MSTMSTFPKNDLNFNGQAHLLRGFAASITNLQKPQLSIVKQIGSDIGLIIYTKEEFKEIKQSIKANETLIEDETINLLTDNDNLAVAYVGLVNSLKTILSSNMTDLDKCLYISKLVKP